jgi:hypothetical protein
MSLEIMFEERKTAITRDMMERMPRDDVDWGFREMGCRLEESIQESSQAKSSFLDLVTPRRHAPRHNVSIQTRLAVPIEAYSQTYLPSRLHKHCSFILFM